MNQTSRALLLLASIAACDRASETEKSAGDTRDAVAKPGVVVPSCPAPAYTHRDPAFCIPLPAGYTVRETTATGISLEGEAISFGVSWSPLDERFRIEAARRTEAFLGTVPEDRGELPAHGLRWHLYQMVEGPITFVARAVGPTHVFECGADWPAEFSETPTAILEACKGMRIAGVAPLAPDRLRDVPGLDLSEVAASKKSLGRDRNGAGLRHHRAGSYAAARTELVKALEADPANILARYNLACTLNLSGDRDSAFVLLAELAQAEDCAACVKQLAHARTDDDFKNVRQDPVFLALTAAGASAKLPPGEPSSPARFATSFARALDERDAAALARLVDASTTIRIHRTCGRCEEEGAYRVTTVTGPRALLVDVGDYITAFAKVDRCDSNGTCHYDLSPASEDPVQYAADGSPPILERIELADQGDGRFVITDLHLRGS